MPRLNTPFSREVSVVQSLLLEIPAYTTDDEVEVSVAHGLDYVPAFDGYIQPDKSIATIHRLPYLKNTLNVGVSITENYYVKASVDETHVYVTLNSDQASNTDTTYVQIDLLNIAAR